MKEPTARWIEKFEALGDEERLLIPDDIRAEIEHVQDCWNELDDDEREHYLLKFKDETK
jgi:hypothetical protein